MYYQITTAINETIRAHQEKLIWLQDHYLYYEHIVAGLQDLKPEIIVGYHCLDISISGPYAALLQMFKVMRADGWTPSTRPRPNDLCYLSFWHKIKEPDVPSVWLMFTSTTCHRVVVGTEVKEVPIYDYRCEEIGNGSH